VEERVLWGGGELTRAFGRNLFAPSWTTKTKPAANREKPRSEHEKMEDFALEKEKVGKGMLRNHKEGVQGDSW